MISLRYSIVPPCSSVKAGKLKETRTAYDVRGREGDIASTCEENQGHCNSSAFVNGSLSIWADHRRDLISAIGLSEV